MNLEFIKNERLRERLVALAEFLKKPLEEVVENLIDFSVGKMIGQIDIGLSETDTYIKDHWETESDEKIAEALKLVPSTIAMYRRRLGFVRRKGRLGLNSVYNSKNERVLGEEEKLNIITLLPSQTNAKIATDFMTTVKSIRALRVGEAQRLIQEGQGKVGDVEVSGKVGIVRAAAAKIRLALGFKLDKNLRKDDAVAKRIDFEDLRTALTVGGYTTTEYVKIHNLRVSRERIRQLCEEHEVPHGHDVRTRQWHLERLARRQGQEKFKDKSWVVEKFEESGKSIYSLAALLNVSRFVAANLINLHGIKRVYTKYKEPKEMVELTCSNPACGKKFKRSEMQIRANKNRRNKQGLPFRPVCGFPCRVALIQLDIGEGSVVLIGNSSTAGGRVKISKEWLKEHYLEFSDTEIATMFEMNKRSIANLRKQLGLGRKKD